MGGLYPNLCLFIFISCFFCHVYSNSDMGPYNSFTISSFIYPRTKLGPYQWRYIRVDLPPWFSSMSFALESDVDLDAGSAEKIPKSTLPMICVRDGSPPVPDISNTSLNDLVLSPLPEGGIQSVQNPEQCYPMQKTVNMKLTNEQISPGVLYFGLFNGIGPIRTQSKMIIRGTSYSFSANIIVEGCTASMLWGQYCNQTIDSLSCTQSDRAVDSVLACRSSLENCHGEGETKAYSLDIVGIAEELTIMAADVRFEESITGNINGIILMCYARHGAMPSATLHDYSGNINKSPLVIRSPKVGHWYITIVPVNLPKAPGGISDASIKACYSMEWQVLQCPVGKAGFNCRMERYMLQTVLQKSPSGPFESHYLPVSGKLSSQSANFPLEPLLSKSFGGETDVPWTYFLLDIPHGAAGLNIHIRLESVAKISDEIYARFGGLPSLSTWDYFYANSSSSSDGSMFFELYDSSEVTVNLYIFYAREGTWGFGLRQLTPTTSAFKDQTTMSISLERCPRGCSPHGSCNSAMDASGLASFGYCFCDRDHGGFDCSIEMVSHSGHVWQSIALIASNAAAALPAFWSLRQKLFAEWVLFTSSGIASGIYHACDVGTWCALSFRVLQFMDFWLSFMAVISTFLHLAAIDEASKRTIHTVVSILTALMAVNGPTKSTNIIFVVVIGTFGLLIGLLIEFSSKYRSFATAMGVLLNMRYRWRNIEGWMRNFFKILLRRFRWGFVVTGFTVLIFAGIGWILETTETYWIWHSVWHVTVYTASFLFLCSKINTVNSENVVLPVASYELTRQDSFSERSMGSF